MGLKEEAEELLNWHKTGVLEGPFVRRRADKIRERLGNAFDTGTALTMAENEVKMEALQFVCDKSDMAAGLASALEKNRKLSSALQRATNVIRQLTEKGK